MNVLPIIALASLLAVAPPVNESATPRVLVFTKTAGFRHDAISAGVATVRELGAEGGFAVDATEDSAAFTPENLARYRAILFLNTSGEVLDEPQKAAFQGFIRGGGGLAAIHQGITTLDKWPWYVALVGGVKFAGHPQIQKATCRTEIRDHPATKSSPESWEWTEEWYNFEPNPRPMSHVLMTVAESSYQGGKMGKDHPISWYREAEGGRVWCTALGHIKESYRLPTLRNHLLGGIRYAAGLAPAVAKVDDRRLDPQARAFIRNVEDSGAPGFESMPVEDARKAFLAMRDLAGEPATVSKVEDRNLPGGPRMRIYSPRGADAGPRPALIYFHGGGWVLGSPETIDAPCRQLANGSGCVVVSVDYRRPPEHPFPIPLDDCYAATRHVADHPAEFGVDAQRIAVGGDSAGGNLAAAVTLMARDKGGPPLAFQLLIYPVTDYACDTTSYRSFGKGYLLTDSAMRWYWSRYLAPRRRPQSAGLAAAGRPARAAAGPGADGRVRPPTRRRRGLRRPAQGRGRAHRGPSVRRAGARLLPDGQAHGPRQAGR